MSTETEEEDDRQRRREVELVKRHTAMLAEHFETVQIFVTRHGSDDEGTAMIAWGTGNWYARYGAAREWVTKQDEIMRESARDD